MAILPTKREAAADDMRLRVVSFSCKKTDKAVEKGLITKEEAEQLDKKVDDLLYKFNNNWWIDKKGMKSYDVIMLMFEGLETETEILKRIEKA